MQLILIMYKKEGEDCNGFIFFKKWANYGLFFI